MPNSPILYLHDMGRADKSKITVITLRQHTRHDSIGEADNALITEWGGELISL